MRLRTSVTLVFFVAVIAVVSYLSLDRPHPAAHKGSAGNPLASNQPTNGRSSVADIEREQTEIPAESVPTAILSRLGMNELEADVLPEIGFEYIMLIMRHPRALLSRNSQIITAFRPLADAADLLQERYAKPVTYEDPIWMWSGDLSPRVGLHPRSFFLPVEASPAHTPMLDDTLIGKVLDAYHTQTDGPRFRVSSSRCGLHIVPTQVRDAAGRFVRAAPPLDTYINVPVAKRTPYGHFAAICDAVTALAGIELEPNSGWLNQYFAPGYPKSMTDQDEEEVSFAWGATGMIAREAIISLLDQSSTRLTWRVYCLPMGYSTFNLMPMQVR